MPAAKTDKLRRADLARIHQLKAALSWDDDLYRDIMATRCNGVRSAAQLDPQSRRAFLDHLQSCHQRNTGKPSDTKREHKPLSPVGKKLWSLWMQAADKGRVQQRTMAALNAWLKRQTGIEAIEWIHVNDKQAELAIESLKKLLTRD